MNMLPAFAVLSLVFYTFLFYRSVKKVSNSLSHTLLALSLVSLIAWAGLSCFAYSAATLARLEFFMPVSMIGMFFYFPLNALFAVSLGHREKSTIPFAAAILAPALFFSVINFFIPVGFKAFVRRPEGWEFIPNLGHPLNTVWLVYAVSMFAVVIIRMIRLIIRHRGKTASRCYAILLIASVLSVIILLLEYILHDFLQRFLPSTISPFLMSIWVSGMYFAAKRHKFLAIFPEETANEILHSLNDFIIFTEKDGTVSFINSQFESYLKNLHLKIFGQSINTVFCMDDEKDITDLFHEDIDPDRPFIFRLRDHQDPEHCSLFSMQISKAGNRSGRHEGYILKGSRYRTIEQLQSDFRLTQRETEVVRLALFNYRNKAIGNAMNITERTVKAHLVHIYEKLNVRNRIELASFISEYQAVS
ncbi:MAG: hypothetical protein JW874_00990 [Spirochaetales bacterium]|nr:hypothetical protein [Spirochaetales bacterium]